MKRTLKLSNLLNMGSFFLFGPRGTGKSYLIREQIIERADYIDLLHSETYLRLKTNPSLIEGMIRKEWVAIDEIQRIPELLNEVHRLIETGSRRFLLTGSSARKLKRGAANLLAGRAYRAEMLPLTWHELQNEENFNLEKYLRFGGLPKAYLEPTPKEYLYSYVDTYLREEIQAEALVRNLSNFARFLDVCALSNAEIINYTKIANDAQLSPNTVRDYFQILEDTLVGFQLPSWKKSQKRKAIQAPKFYFFDVGVVNAMRNSWELEEAGNLFGKAFEQFVGQEIRAYLRHKRIRKELCYWRSKAHHEVDFIIGDEVAIEVKSSQRISEREHKNLALLMEEQPWKHAFIVSRDRTNMNFPSGITHIYWRDFFEKLWSGEIV